MANKAHVEAQKRYNKKTDYDKKNIYRLPIPIHRTNEANLMEWLNKQENRSSYIKALILADMAKHQAQSSDQ